MKRRKFIATAVIGSVCSLANAAVPGIAKVKPTYTYKITVVRRVPGDSGDGKIKLCWLFHDNQVIMAESSSRKPDAFCDTGWEDIQPGFRQIDEGKAVAPICICTGFAPVYFKIEPATT
jgi:hypothetical protein